MDLQESRPREETIGQLQETLKSINLSLDNRRRELHDKGIDDPQVTLFKFQSAMQRLQGMDKDYRDFKSNLGTKERLLVSLKNRLKTVGTDPVSLLDVERELRASPLMAAYFLNVQENEKTIAEIVKVVPPGKIRDNNLRVPPPAARGAQEGIRQSRAAAAAGCREADPPGDGIQTEPGNYPGRA